MNPGNEARKMSAEYRQRLAEILGKEWSVGYVGLSDYAPGGPGKYHVLPQHFIVIASRFSKRLDKTFDAAIGVGPVDGRKRTPKQTADLLRGAFTSMEDDQGKIQIAR